MVMVVADAILESSRRTGRLNASNNATDDQDCQRVVHRLQRDGADFRSDNLGDRISGGMRLTRDGAQDRQALRRYLDSALSKQVRRVGDHIAILDQILE
jgi:hypothetical protein